MDPLGAHIADLDLEAVVDVIIARRHAGHPRLNSFEPLSSALPSSSESERTAGAEIAPKLMPLMLTMERASKGFFA